MAGHEGFAIGVDLGTSNTVAVVRWPDGRTRPLLFDGQPIMPSAVYLDDTGQVHVGRDAIRMAQLDPARYEPNPKRRVDEAAVLLGDRELAVVDLLAALLRAIAAAAVEAVGFLPPAVLTYPAAWGSRRRDTLYQAAARAGWPPVLLLPEPVAAARYFADVLRRPVPFGSSLAVFDFGGGTLDVAVVRREPQGFAVLGSGGIEDLGGLDLDAALVEHLGGLLSRSAPDAWARLRDPRSATDRRHRRLFWDDVRGAKEMLSRTTVAPVPVPGVDQALHLTRDELERLATPMLRRAVYATADVIARCQLAPHQLAGLFLVGGSSRVPLVARVLHAELGIAPSVLEQPELPVAEGALAELAPPPASPSLAPPPGSASLATATLGAASAGTAAPVTPGPPVPPPAPPPSGPVSVSPGPAPPAQPARPLFRRRGTWIAIAAAAVVLALAGTVTWLLYDPYRFSPLAETSATTVDGLSSGGNHRAFLAGGRLFIGAQKEDHFEVRGYANPTRLGSPTWTVGDIPGKVTFLFATPKVVVVDTEPASDQLFRRYLFDSATGRPTGSPMVISSSDRAYVLGDRVVVVRAEAKRIVGYDLTGAEKWSRPHETGVDAWAVASTWDDEGLATQTTGTEISQRDDPDMRLVHVAKDKHVEVVDAVDGTVQAARDIADSSDKMRFYEGTLYVANDSYGYQIQAYDVKNLDKPRWTRNASNPKAAPKWIDVCGEKLVCVGEDTGDKQAVVALDSGSGDQRWAREFRNPSRVLALDGYTMVRYRNAQDKDSTALIGASGTVARDYDGQLAARIDDGSFFLWPAGAGPYSDVTNWAGVEASAAATVNNLGAIEAAVDQCTWTDELVACPEKDAFRVHRFR